MLTGIFIFVTYFLGFHYSDLDYQICRSVVFLFSELFAILLISFVNPHHWFPNPVVPKSLLVGKQIKSIKYLFGGPYNTKY